MFPSNFVEDMPEKEGDETKQPESSLENINNQLNVNGRGEHKPDTPPAGLMFKSIMYFCYPLDSTLLI